MKRTTARVLDFVRNFMAVNGMAPSIREIKEGTGMKSVSTVAYHLDKLEANGWIERKRNPQGNALARSMKIR